ncbi:MAG: acetate kinase [Acholeplasmataceae bacterium]|nr:acetate kinase [Acidaminococcaceae bacterium]NLY84685.1 acetate kinase [Acholeplasmataceae bacterium]
MKIFVLNCGSSSIKYQLIEHESKNVLARGVIERIGMDGTFLKHYGRDGQAVEIKRHIANHSAGIQLVLNVLIDKENGVINDLSEISAFGHRVVHGGEAFREATLINEQVIEDIKKCITMAPLHNPANLAGINACRELMPEVPHAAVFDTAFHQSIPAKAYLYGLPYDLYVKYGLRKYGFHGISHQYVSERAAEYLQKDLSELRLVSCHLGNGASLAAIKGGKSVDTSMGFTPLEGLVMGTRCGEVDPAIIPFIMDREDMTGRQVYQYLNNKAGVLGISGLSSDFRDLERAAEDGDERAQLAMDIFSYRVKKYIGSYAVAMGGIDAIIFTAGLGENSDAIRESICSDLEFLGARLDREKNRLRGGIREIGTDGDSLKLLVIPTNEELVIAEETARLCPHMV